MGLTQKCSGVLFICVLFMLLVGAWALFGCETKLEHPKQKEFPLKKRELDEFLSYLNGLKNDGKGWQNAEKTQSLNIHITNMDEEDQKNRNTDQQIKEALMKIMNKKLKENKIASKQRRRSANVPGLDFRREFASDEPNPYIENLRNRCE